MRHQRINASSITYRFEELPLCWDRPTLGATWRGGLIDGTAEIEGSPDSYVVTGIAIEAQNDRREWAHRPVDATDPLFGIIAESLNAHRSTRIGDLLAEAIGWAAAA
jgi:hypothetical protein